MFNTMDSRLNPNDFSDLRSKKRIERIKYGKGFFYQDIAVGSTLKADFRGHIEEVYRRKSGEYVVRTGDTRLVVKVNNGFRVQKGQLLYSQSCGTDTRFFIIRKNNRIGYAFVKNERVSRSLPFTAREKILPISDAERRLAQACSPQEIYAAIADGADINAYDIYGDNALIRSLDYHGPYKPDPACFKAALRCGAKILSKQEFDGYTVEDVLNSNPQKYQAFLKVLKDFRYDKFKVIENKNMLKLFARQALYKNRESSIAYTENREEKITLKSNRKNAQTGQKFTQAVKKYNAQNQLISAHYITGEQDLR